MAFACFAKSTALLLALVGFALPAHAQTNKPITSGTWYEDRAVAHNSGFDSLVVTFAQSPANKFLNITNVACNISLNSTQSLNEADLVVGSSSGGIDLNRPYPIKGNTTPEIVDTSKVYSIVTNQVFFKIGPGRFPSIGILTSSSGSLSIGALCTIVGNLTDN